MTGRRPPKMKPWRGWSLVYDDCQGSGMFSSRAAAKNAAKGYDNPPRVVPVEVRQIDPKRKARKP